MTKKTRFRRLDAQKKAETDNMRRSIMEVLNGGEMTAAAICERLELTSPMLGNLMKKLVAEGYAERTRNSYGLVKYRATSKPLDGLAAKAGTIYSCRVKQVFMRQFGFGEAPIMRITLPAAQWEDGIGSP